MTLLDARTLRLPAAFLFLLLAVPAAAAGIELADDRGVLVRLSAPARRIVALAPHLAELAFAAGAGDRLVGVARFSDHPPQAGTIAQIGDAARVDLERIIALKPGLILGWRTGNQAGDLERLGRLGYAVFVTEPARLPDIPRVLRAIGALAGTGATAERAAAAFENEMRALRARYGARPGVRVFYEVWHRPLITVNGAHIISGVIEICGGENVFARAAVLTPTISLEALAAARPEVALGGAGADDAGAFARRWAEGPLAALRGVPALHVNPDHLQRSTPRILEGARAVCAHLEQVRKNRKS
ncbi:MAG: cobalamin-binding protein [Betaproteobacteria bacterium]|nr:cobalamin-binding protein [Betaproteobacteria bacterium]